MQTEKGTGGPTGGGAYRWYVLGLFTLVYAFNFIDRQIVTILAPYLKTDLGLTDAQVGLLFGTAFALFYALFGLPLAKLADGWHRVRALSLGLALWSAMTAASGMAGSFAALAGARVGVGIGEASASPAAFSILQDYFPKAMRGTALSIYASGIYLGAGASLMVGGAIVSGWNAAYPVNPPLGLTGWQAAYFAVGLPGLVLALLVAATVREPVRGLIDGTPQPPAAHPFRDALGELAAMFPILAGRLRTANLVLLAACVAGAVLATRVTDMLLAPAKRAAIAQIGGVVVTTNLVQWSAIAIGIYATWGWIASLRTRDPVAARLILGTPSFVALAVGGGALSVASYGLSAFIFVYGRERLGLEASAGWTIGAIAAVSGGIGTPLGGILGDALRRRVPAGRVYMAAFAATASALLAAWQYDTTSVPAFYIAYALGILALTMWLGPIMATGQDQVLPRLRGTATAVQFLGINLIGLGLGPYVVGLISDSTGDLRFAMLAVLGIVPVAVALFLFAARRLPEVERTLIARARAAGEPL